ncbi:MAG: hypothetical protein NT026_02315 [Candidatus Staskawiczbacteria bacterium]|nr:hypothetical protein [Candidatus Staskawiczbacteria bacterium]
METNKIIGYVSLAVGLLLIILPLWQTYSIFTGKSVPAQVFMRPIALQVNDKVSALDIPGQIQNALIRVIPIDFIDNTLNLATWLLLLYILIYGGGKIAEIGVKLLNGTK